jgi:hypothetical protein
VRGGGNVQTERFFVAGGTEEDWVVLSEMTCLGLTAVGEDEGDGE